MTYLSKLGLGVLVSSSVLMTTSTHAAPEFYLSGKLGYTSAEAGLDANPTIWGYDSIEDTTATIGLSTGITFNRFIGVELGYTDYGEYSEDYTRFYASPNNNITGKANGEVSMFSLSVVSSIPVSNMLLFYGELGVARWNLDFQDEDTNVLLGAVSIDKISDSNSGTDVFYAIGANLNVTDSFGIFIEYESLSFESSLGFIDLDTELETFSLGAKFSF